LFWLPLSITTNDARRATFRPPGSSQWPAVAPPTAEELSAALVLGSEFNRPLVEESGPGELATSSAAWWILFVSPALIVAAMLLPFDDAKIGAVLAIPAWFLYLFIIVRRTLYKRWLLREGRLIRGVGQCVGVVGSNDHENDAVQYICVFPLPGGELLHCRAYRRDSNDGRLCAGAAYDGAAYGFGGKPGPDLLALIGSRQPLALWYVDAQNFVLL
jgi:hypothetical protein